MQSTTSFLTSTTSAYATGAGITAAAGTRLALQLILTALFTKAYMPCTTEVKFSNGDDTLLRCLTVISSGQFSLLLPALAVEAMFQASSPESNPNSPLPVIAISIPAIPIHG